ILLLAVCLVLSITASMAQTVTVARNAYTGNTSWNASTGTFTISSTGAFNFSNRSQLYKNVWNIPSQVKRIIIKSNVTVTAEFYADYNCTIQGENKYTSVVFGTPKQDYLGEDRGFYAFASAPSKARNVVLTIKNLTSLNPKVYHCWGSYRGVIHTDNCRYIDDRGGRWNNSDGYVSAKGGTVKNCYFSTGDDVIKIYNDITVENTTIHMEFFSVPIQCGWGNYGNNVKAVFKNLTITGNSGRSPHNALIEARQGNYTKHIIIDGLTYTNPNGALFNLQQAAATINVEIKNANINIKKYGDVVKAKGKRTICGTTQRKSFYNCKGGNTNPNPNPNAIALPKKIEAELFTKQSGIGTETTSDAGGGKNVGWINNGDWTEYKVDVTQGGSYDVGFRVATGSSGGTINVKVNNVKVGSVKVSNTGGWQNWKTVSTKLNLSTGVKTLKFEYTGGAGFLFNLNWANFQKAKTGTSGTSAPTGKVINIKGDNGLYVSSEDGLAAMNCNRASASTWEKFTVVNAGSGKIALKGSNGKYVSGGSPMWCNQTSITNAAKFTWTNAGSGKFALKGSNGKFVSSENGTKAMNCNRTAIGAWEKFSWNVASKSSENLVDSDLVNIYPNPASSEITIELGQLEEYATIEIYNTTGQLELAKTLHTNFETVSVEELNSGMYIVRVSTSNKVSNKTLIVK
ncbi:MAG: carbohydrate-binding protein, partial [Bacteroidales bacterium]|nr:carbohydrate-binding protein [Bacteroidales bacterium]